MVWQVDWEAWGKAFVAPLQPFAPELWMAILLVIVTHSLAYWATETIAGRRRDAAASAAADATASAAAAPKAPAASEAEVRVDHAEGGATNSNARGGVLRRAMTDARALGRGGAALRAAAASTDPQGRTFLSALYGSLSVRQLEHSTSHPRQGPLTDRTGWGFGGALR